MGNQFEIYGISNPEDPYDLLLYECNDSLWELQFTTRIGNSKNVYQSLVKCDNNEIFIKSLTLQLHESGVLNTIKKVNVSTKYETILNYETILYTGYSVYESFYYSSYDTINETSPLFYDEYMGVFYTKMDTLFGEYNYQTVKKRGLRNEYNRSKLVFNKPVVVPVLLAGHKTHAYYNGVWFELTHWNNRTIRHFIGEPMSQKDIDSYIGHLSK